MIAVYRRELKRFFATPFGCLICAALLLSSGLAVTVFNLLSGYTSFALTLKAMQWALIVIIPLMTLRSIAEERQKRTDVLLYSLPVPLSRVVLGKYFAVLTLFLVPTAVMALYPVLLSSFGELSMPAVYISLLAYLLMGAALLAIALFLSSLAPTRLISAIFNLGAMLALYLLGLLAKVLPDPIARVLGALLPFSVYNRFTYGHMDLAGIVFYLTVTVFFLYATVCIVEKRRNAPKGSGTVNRTKSTRRGVILCLLLVGCILFDLLVALLPERIKSLDLSGNDTFRISGTTTDFLSTLDGDVTLTLFCEGGRANADGELYAFLCRYADASKRVTLRVTDPEKDPALIDALGGSVPENMSVAVQSDTRTKLVGYTDLFYYRLYDASSGSAMSLTPAEYASMLAYYAQQENGAAYIAQLTSSVTALFDGESRVTNAIRYVLQEKTAVIYELDALGTAPLESSFVTPLIKGSFELRTATTSSIPEDCALLIVNTPTSDLSDKAYNTLSDYLTRGGKLLLTTVAGSTAERLPKLTALLASYGLEMPQEEGMLCEGSAGYLLDGSTPYLFYTRIQSAHPATADFDGQFAALAPHAITLTPTEGVTHTEWLYTSKKGYLLDGSGEKLGEDSTLTCGAIAEKGDSAILWISSSYALSATADSYSQGGNYTLLHSAISTLTNTPNTPVPLSARTMDTATLAPSESAFIIWGAILILLIPIATTTLALTTWYVRKRR